MRRSVFLDLARQSEVSFPSMVVSMSRLRVPGAGFDAGLGDRKVDKK